ncbi:MAG: hydroxymethylbilane synthase [Kiritimatiellae bacterium]|nr:hydroxymethylbilane synthase [Kiritimatiellia bacterium]
MKVGARESRLSVIQTRQALARLATHFPALRFDLTTFRTVGDRDTTTDLRVSPPDFFTRELDDALRAGAIDCAVHSAKDLPDPVPEDLDWFWLPWREDPRDAWVLPVGRTMADLSEAPVVGVSSERREACCRRRFPKVVTKPVRGSIPDRLAQLDAGAFDALLMAGAALNRLELSERVTEWIPLTELEVPEGQGYLAVTFRKGDERFLRLRAPFLKAVRFVGAGVGSADFCTWGGIQDLRRAEVCLYDVLMDEALLGFLPADAKRIFVGKRCGGHALRQPEITALITRYARQGKRVVRLKGGDPGLFGRLAEETEALEALAIPYRVRAGVSALTVATTGTGMLLTRRGESRGFTALTPRVEGGGTGGVTGAVRERFPLALFMSVKVSPEAAEQLLQEGWPASTPVAGVFNAGADDEWVERTTLAGMREGVLAALPTDAPGLLIIGSAAAHGYNRKLGAFAGKRVLLTCSEALREKAVTAVTDLGGWPIMRPMIRLVPCAEARVEVARLDRYDWVVLTSPSAVNVLMELIRSVGIDARRIPKVMTCGPGSAAALRRHGIEPDLTPAMVYSAEGLARALEGGDWKGRRILRMRSEKAGSFLADLLRGMGAEVEDVVLYRNERVSYGALPSFDALFFASASAVEAFVEQFSVEALRGVPSVVLGQPTAKALRAVGVEPAVIAPEATVEAALRALSISISLSEESVSDEWNG